MISTDFIKGVIVPIITPIDEDERIDEARLRRQVDFVIKGGLHGILAFGSNGEFYQLEEDEQQRLGEIMTPVDTYIDEMTLKFITGAEPLDNFDNFRATIKSMGIDEALQLKQDGLDAYMAKEVK